LSVFVFVQGKEPAEDGSGFGIGQVDLTQIPESRAHAKPLEMVIAGGDLKTDTLQTDGAVGAALGAIHFSRESYFKFGTRRTRPAYIAMVEVALQRSLSQFRVDGPVVFHLDRPAWLHWADLSQISDSFDAMLGGLGAGTVYRTTAWALDQALESLKERIDSFPPTMHLGLVVFEWSEAGVFRDHLDIPPLRQPFTLITLMKGSSARERQQGFLRPIA
jgi:hypothetical protein